MKQLFAGASIRSLGTGTKYSSLQFEAFTTDEAAATGPWSASGTFSNFQVTFGSAPGAGTSYTFTVRINGVDSALTVTISDTNTVAIDTTHSVSISAGDRISIKMVSSGVPTSPSSIAFNVEFTTTGNLSGYQFADLLQLTNSSTTYFGLLTTKEDESTTAAPVTTVCPTSGTISRWDIRIENATSAGKSWTCTIYKNGVKQDGSGGTVNTTITIANGASTGSASGFSLSVSQGDTLYQEWVPSGSPTVTNWGYSFDFTASSAVAILAGFCPSDTMGTGSTEYCVAVGFGASGWQASESNAPPMNAWQTNARITNLTLLLDGSPGAAKSYQFNLRKNNATPGGGPTVTLTNTTTGQDNSGKLQLNSSTDTWGIQSIPSGTPTARHAAWSVTVEVLGSGGGAGKGNSGGNKKGGGGGISVIYPLGALEYSIGNAGLDIGST